ncbi:MAG: DUF2752 domain-containing protein [Candidatus Sulfotelmatobacter sp.]
MEINVCPPWVLAKLGVSSGKRAHAGILLSSLLALTISPILVRLPHFCLAQKILGIPCPGCGVMHSLIALLHFQLQQAWVFNPAGIVLATYLVLQIFGRCLVLASVLSGGGVSAMSKHGQTGVIAALFAVWLVRLINL